MERVRHDIKALSYLGMGIIGLLIINSILFTHSQTLSDGSVVIHAHPYDKTETPPANNKHHENELLILNSITLLFFLGSIAFSLKGACVYFEKKRLPQIEYINVLVLRKFGRAPPVQ
ncbi:hypothetical protein [Ancylomarina sp.]|uniref:hypothetical protein n=1 Tax=Ancylomarina sp. TaxID=1970196 RepID=UPI0035622CBA